MQQRAPELCCYSLEERLESCSQPILSRWPHAGSRPAQRHLEQTAFSLLPWSRLDSDWQPAMSENGTGPGKSSPAELPNPNAHTERAFLSLLARNEGLPG